MVQPTEEKQYFSRLKENQNCGLVIATACEILGRERSRRPIRSKKAIVRKKEVDQALDFSELVERDYLVHHQHGICQFKKLGKIEEGQGSEEAITLEFADGILLHVPLQESHLLSRYVGLKKARPKLAKLGGKAWANVKQAAEIAALDLAADLLRLQATRDSNYGHSFPLMINGKKNLRMLSHLMKLQINLKQSTKLKKIWRKNNPWIVSSVGMWALGKQRWLFEQHSKRLWMANKSPFLHPPLFYVSST